MNNQAGIIKVKKIIKRCQKSSDYFIDSFCKVKHPNAGVIPFHLFGYQRKCLKAFKENRFNIFGKTRQSGISTLSGAFALWLAMFFKHKTILVVSKRDKDAKEFLSRNIRFVYNQLPEWMKAIWVPTTNNEHEFGFANGSKITSLPSGPDTLRANSSSLNIIDEAGFCPHMEEMWAGGYPTLQHGGSVIVISTSNGIGNWYWKTWTDAEENMNDFNPLVVDWWDMDWVIEYQDDVSGDDIRIAPTDGIRKCTTKEEKELYGPWWSPWLETQRKQLTEKGNDAKFRQEVLRDFLGSGSTVLSRETLLQLREQAREVGKTYKTASFVDYIQPITGESYSLDFEDNLWIWDEPKEDHIYVAGVDISSGEASDFSAIEIFDVTTAEQVAELQIKVKPKVLSVMADYLGRWYNNAFLVPERTGMGVTVCQDLEELVYPNIFRKNMMPTANKKLQSNQNIGPIGYPTSGVGKPILNKAMIDNLGETGYRIKSYRLAKQAETYVRLGLNKTGAEKGMNDDLIIAAGLAFVGNNLAVSRESGSLLPFKTDINLNMPGSQQLDISQIKDFSVVAPVIIGSDSMPQEDQAMELNKFTASLVVPMTDRTMKTVSTQRPTLNIRQKYK